MLHRAALQEGVSVDAPLVVKGADGVEYHFTGLGVDDSLGQIVGGCGGASAGGRCGRPGDGAKAQQCGGRGSAGAYPEMRTVFHGVWIYAEASGKESVRHGTGDGGREVGFAVSRVGRRTGGLHLKQILWMLITNGSLIFTVRGPYSRPVPNIHLRRSCARRTPYARRDSDAAQGEVTNRGYIE